MSEIKVLSPPNDINLENAVLGAILMERNAIYEAMTIIKPDVFYSPKNKEIYKAVIKLQSNNEPIDLLTVTNYLRQKNTLEQVGGAYYVSKLTNNVGSAAHIRVHCMKLYELFLKRETLLTLQRNIANIHENSDIYNVYNQTSAELSQLFEMSLSSDFFMMGEIMKDRLKEISEIKTEKKEMLGINTGFSKLNKLTSGLQSGDFIILAARPSMGKTIVSLLIAKAAMFQSNVNVLYFSIEMAKERLADRLLSLESNIDSMKIASNNLEPSDWNALDIAAARYTNGNLYIIDESGLTIEDIRARSITLNRKYKIGLIIIDYIQIIKHSMPHKNTNDNVTHISKNIKALAKETNCPVVGLSQLKRNENRLPVLSDLRDSGSLEQDADIVWFLHREDYEDRDCEVEDKKRIQNIIAKDRNGAIGMFYTYRNENWSYIGEMPQDELNSFDDQYNVMTGIEPAF